MAARYSIFRLIREALAGHRGWEPAWREPEPKANYDVIIVGGGGHGLATAYYLAKVHGIRNVAVIEKGYLGSGNVGRNTTIVRSNYLLPGNIPFYEWSLKLWEGLEQDFNYNAMVSQRGVLNLFHSDSQRDAFARRGNSMRLHGVDGEILGVDDIRRLLPYADFDNARFPIRGGLLQPRGGTVRHDAVAWGYARGADQLGVDLIQHCEVIGIRKDAGGAVVGVETTRGPIRARKVGTAVSGHTGQLAAKVGLKLPHEGRRRLQGEIVGVEGEQVVFAVDGQRFAVPFQNIDKARIVPDWAALGFAPSKPGKAPKDKPSKPEASKK